MYIPWKRYRMGYIKIKVQGKNKERFFNVCKSRNIFFWNMQSEDEASYTAYLLLSDYWKLKDLARKAPVKVYVQERRGFPFFLETYKKRIAFFAAFFMGICVIYGMSYFLWDISFEGNSRYSDEVLRAFLREQGYHHGMLLDDIVCDRIEKLVRNEYNEITWVSARIDGTSLVVHIKENDGVLQSPEKDTKPCDIVATEDGVVASIITRQGTPMVHVGDMVKKGDILVSGAVELRDDNKEVVSVSYVPAEADIYLRQEWKYTDTISRTIPGKWYKEEVTGWYFRILSSEMIFTGEEFWKDDTREECVQCKQLTIFHNLTLPIYYGTWKGKDYDLAEIYLTEKLTLEQLEERLENFLEKIEEKGIQIIEKNVTIEVEHTQGTCTGSIVVLTPCLQTAPVTYQEDWMGSER